ncbi:hypothetical protein [Chlorogloeopsis sp. ULAP02]|uniref:hypothetical protein n=1 Tax=Chlorogloeopsis sp. ULAP02 TaxID=3107926 RepID=UPI003136F0F2
MAGFPLPVLRYFAKPNSPQVQLLQPNSGNILSAKQLIRFVWQEFAGASAYKLEVYQGETSILSAILAAGKTSYFAPPWLKERSRQPLRWQIKALNADGSVLAESAVNDFRIQP